MDAISVENVSKCYKVVDTSASSSYLTLREELVRLAAWPWRRQRRDKERDRFFALQNVDVRIRPGERVGIVGRNGAGKSTLLKILSRVTLPTSGRVRLRGRVGSLLEVGTGFHPELTGRENVYLSGIILGMRRSEVAKRFDEIVAFAEVEKFIDTPVKRYSSGMYTRLAFAVTAHLDTEILIVDEVLAVGDAAFQQKCMGKIREVGQRDRTILLVSHNMSAINSVCDRAVWLEQGRLVEQGVAREVTERYLDSSLSQGAQLQRSAAGGSQPVEIVDVLLKNSSGQTTNRFSPAESLSVEIHYRAARRQVRPRFVVTVRGQLSLAFTASMLLDDQCPEYIEGAGVLTCTFPNLQLLPQPYVISMGARCSDNITPLVPSQDVATFYVAGPLREYGRQNPFADELAISSAPVVVPYEWRLPDGTVARVDQLRRQPASTVDP